MRDLFYTLVLLVFSIGSLVAWVTHVATCLHDEAWGFLVAGAIFFPIGIFHGVGIWLGFY